MEIYILDKDPQKLAEYLTDRDVVKMNYYILYTLNNAHVTIKSKYSSDMQYRIYMWHKMWTNWIVKSIDNYTYLLNFIPYIMNEVEYRFDRIQNKVETYRKWFSKHYPDLPKIGIIKPPLTIPIGCMTNTTIDSYRNYYRMEKQHHYFWTRRERPRWIDENKNKFCK